MTPLMSSTGGVSHDRRKESELALATAIFVGGLLGAARNVTLRKFHVIVTVNYAMF